MNSIPIVYSIKPIALELKLQLQHSVYNLCAI